MALASVGDLRAIEMLAKRLRSVDTELPLWSPPQRTERCASRKLLQPHREDERLLAARLGVLLGTQLCSPPVLWPFLIAVVVFWLAIFVGRKRGNLATMRDLMNRHAAVCRKIAVERVRLASLRGDEHTAAATQLEALERGRQKLESRAVRLRETLLKAGFAVQDAQLTTVEDAEAELKAELARRSV